MDLKFKGAAWVGNVYQKFEAICQEVDDLVCRDTVKYVENQAQTVGDNVKRFCTNVVQDILPSSLVEFGKHEAEVVSLMQNDTIGACVRSTIVIEEKPLLVDQSSVEQYAIDPLNSPEQCIYLATANHVTEAESDLSLGPEVEALQYKKFNIVCEENDTEELVDKMPDIGEENNTNEKLLDKKSDMVVEENDTKDEASQPGELELIFAENNDFSEVPLLSESIDEKNGILAAVPPAALDSPTQIDKIACISFSDEVECFSDISTMLPPSEMNLSVVSGENKTAEVGLISSSSSLFTESVSGFSHENVAQYEENICYNSVDAIGCVSDLSDSFSSSQPFPILSCENKVVDRRLSFSSSGALSLESNGVDISIIHGAAALAGSSGNWHEYCHEGAQLEFLMSPSEIGEADDFRVDFTDPSMETIDLSENEKLDDSCVVVDNKLLYPCRAQRHRSYKKILQDAFASKRRIRKEYEQLAILYGDIEIESSRHPGQSILLPSLSLDSKKSSQDLCDPDWELL